MVQQILRLFDTSFAEELIAEELTEEHFVEEHLTEEHFTEEGAAEEYADEQYISEEYLSEEYMDEQDEPDIATGTLLQETQQLFHSDGSEAELVALIHKAIDAIHELCA